MVYKLITRSKGVVIFAVTLIAFGAFGSFLLILSLALISLKDFPQLKGLMPSGMISLPLFWISSFLNLLIYVSWVVCGIGTLHLHDWARQALRVVMAVYIINMMINICLNIFLAEEVMSKVPLGYLMTGIGISICYYLSVVYFFSHPNIVRQFKYKSREY
jgi:hypothetical protein